SRLFSFIFASSHCCCCSCSSCCHQSAPLSFRIVLLLSVLCCLLAVGFFLGHQILRKVFPCLTPFADRGDVGANLLQLSLGIGLPAPKQLCLDVADHLFQLVRIFQSVIALEVTLCVAEHRDHVIDHWAGVAGLLRQAIFDLAAHTALRIGSLASSRNISSAASLIPRIHEQHRPALEALLAIASPGRVGVALEQLDALGASARERRAQV